MNSISNGFNLALHERKKKIIPLMGMSET